MIVNDQTPDDKTTGAPARSPRPVVWLAWLVILAVCGYKVADVVVTSLGLADEGSETDQPVISLNVELVGKVLVGGASLSPDSVGLFMGQAEAFKETGPGDRLGYIILALELTGPEAAQAALDDTSIVPADLASAGWSGDQIRLLTLLREAANDRAAGDPSLPSLDETERADIEELAGWLGRLLLHPEGGPEPQVRALMTQRAVASLLAFIVIGGTLAAGCLVGLVGLIILLTFAAGGSVRRGLIVPGNAGGGIYLEAFAIWTLIFLGIQMALGLLNRAELLPADLALAATIIGFFGSLLAVGWPVVRGVPWRQVRQDIGWTGGRGVANETVVAGLGGYAMVLPIAGVGLILVVLLVQLQQYLLPDAPPPSHPAQQMASSGNWAVIAQLYVIACIAAPIVEETVFRGVLFRYFREATTKWGLVASFLASAMATSLLFAAIHPQGLAAIPALMGLAIGFCLLREWRGSLLGPMVAHGLNNFLIISLNVMLFGA